jgi:hypothetical protein
MARLLPAAPVPLHVVLDLALVQIVLDLALVQAGGQPVSLTAPLWCSSKIVMP